jgi:hypothetical protein
MNKTVYLREEEVPIWEKARELSGDKLSPVILSALKTFIAAKEAEGTGYERIVVEFCDAADSMLKKKKAFYGRWLLGHDKRFYISDEDSEEADVYMVAETAKGNVVVIKHTETRDTMSGKQFLVYSSFAAAAADRLVSWAVREAFERRGIPVEELDI